MFGSATPEIFERAKLLRENQTATEKIVWEYLRHKPLGFRFRRQHPFDQFIVDFYCHSLKLIVEIDGGIHLDKEVRQRDEIRQECLENAGMKVIRFTNEEILTNFSAVTLQMENLLASLSQPKK